jgi:hypothetical protein
MKKKLLLLIFTIFIQGKIGAQTTTVRDSLNGVKLKDIEILSNKTNYTDFELINIIKNKNSIISGISSEQISKSQDRDAAEVIKRIAGVTLFDDRFIIVRGISQRYNNVWLNGINAPSSEADKRAFSLEIIPSSLIENILVYKTPSADLPGDFSGGMTKINTKTPINKKEFQINFNGFFREGTTFKTLAFTEESRLDFLGFGKKFRDLPSNIPNSFEQSSASLTKSFKNTWVLNNKIASPDIRFSSFYNCSFNIGKIKISSLSSINYSREFTYLSIKKLDYSTSIATILADEPSTSYKDIQCTNLVNLGLLQNLNFQLNSNNRIEIKTLYNQSGKEQSVVRKGMDDDANVLAYRFGYQQKNLLTTQFSYYYSPKNKKYKYYCILGYSLNKRSDPDLRQITYQYPPDTFYRSNIPAGSGQLDITEGATRSYSNLIENIYSINQEFKKNIEINNKNIELSVGSYVEFKNRTFNSRMFGYTLPVSTIKRFLTGLPVSDIFSDKYIDIIDTSMGQNKSAGFTIREFSNVSNNYQGQNKLIAPYILANYDVLNKLDISAGIRYENNTQYLQTIVGVDSINVINKTSYFLPSINIKYKLDSKSGIRFAYGKTLNRPEFREWSPYLYYDLEMLVLSHGSLFPSIDHPNGVNLKTATIENIDLQYEIYPSSTEMFNFGIFYKYFINPIEQIAEAHEHRTGVSRELSFHNADAAFCLGFETEFRKKLKFINKWFGLDAMKNIYLISNLSLIKSEVLNKTDSNIKNRPLQGQAPFIINFGFQYSNITKTKNWNISLLYNVTGPYIFVAGGTDGPGTKSGPSIGQMAKNNIDLLFTKNINKNIILNFGIKDILNQPFKLVEDSNQDSKFNNEDKIISYYKLGRYYSIGLKINLQ